MTPTVQLAHLKEAAARSTSPLTAQVRVQVTNLAYASTRDGKPFAELSIADGTGQEKLRVWGDSPAFHALKNTPIVPGLFVRIAAAFSVNDYGLQMRTPALDLLTPMEEQEVLAGSEQARADNEKHWQEVRGFFAGWASPVARFAACACDAFEEPLRRAAAAAGNHHARRGGLIEHTASMMGVAARVAGCYPEMSVDLLCAGVLFHDLAKIYENDYEPKGFRQVPTLRGRLLGHIPLGHEIIAVRWREFHGDQWPELRDHLIHLVLCHHGAKEWGSPVEPMTPEGLAIHYIDMLDSRIEEMRASYRNPDSFPGVCPAAWPLKGSVARPWGGSAESVRAIKAELAGGGKETMRQ